MPERWGIDEEFESRPVGPPADVRPGEDLDDDKRESAMAYWRTLTAEARRCCTLEAGEPTDDDVRATKMGGTPLWSRAELGDWPLCQECGDEMRLRYQLRKADVRGLICRPDTDMLQLFWCINDDCGEEEACFFHRWLAESSVVDPIDPVEEGLSVPEPARPLVVTERVDYANVSEHSDNHQWVSSGVSDLVVAGHEDEEFLDAWDKFHASGEKVGGFVSWVQWGWKCCEQPLHPIVQTGWAEGYQYLLACGDCGKYFSEYQGT